MSSKKAIRKKRQERTKEQQRRLDPATIFILIVVTGLIFFVVGALVFTDRTASAPEGPPWPGAVWSPEHQHWH